MAERTNIEWADASFEHEMTDALHKWVKEYFGARLWAEFESAQLPLIPKKLADDVRSGKLKFSVHRAPKDKKK